MREMTSDDLARIKAAVQLRERCVEAALAHHERVGPAATLLLYRSRRPTVTDPWTADVRTALDRLAAEAGNRPPAAPEPAQEPPAAPTAPTGRPEAHSGAEAATAVGCVLTDDRDMEAFAELPDCEACDGTGKQIPPGWYGDGPDTAPDTPEATDTASRQVSGQKRADIPQASDGPGWDRCEIEFLLAMVDDASRDPSDGRFTVNQKQALRALRDAAEQLPTALQWMRDAQHTGLKAMAERDAARTELETAWAAAGDMERKEREWAEARAEVSRLNHVVRTSDRIIEQLDAESDTEWAEACAEVERLRTLETAARERMDTVWNETWGDAYAHALDWAAGEAAIDDEHRQILRDFAAAVRTGELTIPAVDALDQDGDHAN